MKYKIKLSTKSPEKNTQFLWEARYCGKCLNTYWLEKVKVKTGQAMCECGASLWYTKGAAIREYQNLTSKERGL